MVSCRRALLLVVFPKIICETTATEGVSEHAQMDDPLASRYSPPHARVQSICHRALVRQCQLRKWISIPF